jgi:Tetratricopeptide repeat
MHDDVLARLRRVLGADHHDTLVAASALAITLRQSGDHRGALEIERDVLARRRGTLGEDHPDTLSAAYAMGSTLHSLGDHAASREIAQDVLSAVGGCWGRTTRTRWKRQKGWASCSG